MSEPVLFVDDEPMILAGIQRQLGRRYAITTATSGEEALRLVSQGGGFTVVVSDMRMPGMSGVELLGALERSSPDTVRIMLTGDDRQATAAEAVNRASVFRFLTKPVNAADLGAAIDGAIEAFRLRRAERELLEQTLGGTVKVMVDLLAATDPSAFSRTMAIREHALALAELLGLRASWELSLSAMLSQVGWIAIPAETRSRLAEGITVGIEEEALLRQVPTAGRNLIATIPRLQRVAEIVYLHSRGYDGSGIPADGPAGDGLPVEARILKVAEGIAEGEARGLPTPAAVARLGSTRAAFDPVVLAAAARLVAHDGNAVEALALRLAQIATGDVLLAAIETIEGRLVLASGERVTDVTMARLRALHQVHRLREPIQVSRIVRRRAPAMAPAS